MFGVREEVVYLAVAALCAAQAGLGALFVLVLWPALRRWRASRVKIAEWWLLALLSTTAPVAVGWLAALLDGGEAARVGARWWTLFYLAQVPFGVAGTVAYPLADARDEDRERAAALRGIRDGEPAAG